jgi:hypothetical protein
MGRSILLTLAACVVASAQLSPTQQSALIGKAKDAGVAYTEQLKRFSASQRKVRSTVSVDDAAKGKWKRLEVQESDLDFDADKLSYTLRRVDGDAKNPERRIKKGYFEAWGEFMAIDWVFEPERKATLTWDREETDGTCVLSYRVPQATSSAIIDADGSKAQLAHQGRISVDCATGSILRIQVKTDPGVVKLRERFGSRDIAVGVEMDVRYAPTVIAEQQYLLPGEAVLIGRFGDELTKAETSFFGYRKYAAKSSIVFDQP